ncbi:MAG: xanthine dehydrogenase, partial [Verrucomicrobiota bacterium]
MSGKSEYVDDVSPPSGLLHAAVFGSPSAHGKIVSLDLEAARAIEGVHGVFTYDDIPGNRMLGAVVQDEPLFAHDEVMYQGHPLALIVAESHEVARKGVKACSVTIEDLPVITCPREAFAKNELLQETRIFEKGDVDSVWDKCSTITEGK